MKNVVIDNVELRLPHPDELSVQWIGQNDILKQLIVARLIVDDKDISLNPRLLGEPGVGKTTLAYSGSNRARGVQF